jgi:hypothetical protein
MKSLALAGLGLLFPIAIVAENDGSIGKLASRLRARCMLYVIHVSLARSWNSDAESYHPTRSIIDRNRINVGHSSLNHVILPIFLQRLVKNKGC